MAQRSSRKNIKNPMLTGKRVNPVSRAMPRRRGPKVSFDGTTFSSSVYALPTTSLVNVASSLIVVDAANTAITIAPQQTFSAAGALSALTGSYQEYKYTKLMVSWLPTIGPGQAGAGSRITAAYFDNPEVITNLTANASLALVAMVKGNRTAVSWNAWEPYTFHVPLTYRRKMFDVNTTTVYTNVDANDRGVQGLVVVVTESINAAETLGQIKVTSDVMVKGLSLTTPT